MWVAIQGTLGCSSEPSQTWIEKELPHQARHVEHLGNGWYAFCLGDKRIMILMDTGVKTAAVNLGNACMLKEDYGDDEM